jgi:hypothetical protein
MGSIAFRHSASSLRACARSSAALVLGAVMAANAQQAPPPASPATQAAAPAAAAKTADVSKEAMVVDKLITRIREEADGTGTRETTAQVRVLTDAGVKQMAVLAGRTRQGHGDPCFCAGDQAERTGLLCRDVYA